MMNFFDLFKVFKTNKLLRSENEQLKNELDGIYMRQAFVTSKELHVETYHARHEMFCENEAKRNFVARHELALLLADNIQKHLKIDVKGGHGPDHYIFETSLKVVIEE